MKTTANHNVKELKDSMKAINEILKAVREDDQVLDQTYSNYTYDNAMARNRKRFFDLMSQINEMAETAANLYNQYTVGCDSWMTAQATYKMEEF